MLVVAITPEQRELAAGILLREAGVQPCADMQALLWVNDDRNQVEWVVGYTGFIGKTCQMHVVSFTRTFTPRKLLWAAFDYPFNQVGCEIVFGVVNSKNELAMRYDQHLGFKESQRFPGVHDNGGDLVLFKMEKAECRWIKERKQDEKLVA